MNEGNLHKWFKGSKSKDGKSGWVNVVTGGTCASDKPGEGTPKCVSSSKRASMTKAERKSAARRKKAADPGQQSKTGAAKPTYVSTDKPKKVKEDIELTDAYGEPFAVVQDIIKPKPMKTNAPDIESYETYDIEAMTEEDKKGKSSGKKDACYHKVKASASVWPSAYASGRLVQCRKKGAKNYGNSTKKEEFENLPELSQMQINAMRNAGIEVEEVQEDDKSYDRNRKRAAQRAADRNAARAAGKTGAVPGVGYVTARKEKESYTDSKGVERHKSGAKNEELEIDEGKSSRPVGEPYHTMLRGMKQKKGAKNDPNNKYLRMQTTKKQNKKSADADAYRERQRNERGLSMYPEEVEQVGEEVKEVTEAMRVPAQNGNVYLVAFTWKGKYMMMKLFFPEIKKPSRKGVQSALDKVYPGSMISRFDLSALDNKELYINVSCSEETEVVEAVKGQDTEMRKAGSAERKSGEKRLAPSKGKGYADQQKQSINYMDKKTKNNKIIVGMTHEETEVAEGAAWTKKSGKNKEGGLNEKGRKSYEAENPGSDLKAPSKKVGNKRRSSFCARMKGMRKRQKPSNNTGDDRLSKSLRAWNC